MVLQYLHHYFMYIEAIMASLGPKSYYVVLVINVIAVNIIH